MRAVTGNTGDLIRSVTTDEKKKKYFVGAVALLAILVVLLIVLGKVGPGYGTGGVVSGSDVPAASANKWNSSIEISEVMSNNSLFAKCSDGMYYDWIELHNTTSYDIDLTGWGISDDAEKLNKYVINDYIIRSGEYDIIYLSRRGEKDSEGKLHTTFALSSAGESIFLSDENGNIIYTIEMPASEENVSYGIMGNELVWFSTPTPGKANGGDFSDKFNSLEYPTAEVRINEVMTSNKSVLYDCEGDYGDWIELFNPTDKAVELGGYSLTDDPANTVKWLFPEGASINSGEYMIVFCSGKDKLDAKGFYHTSFRLGKEDTAVMLCTPQGKTCDVMNFDFVPENASCGLISDSDAPVYFSIPTPGRENDTVVAKFTEEQLNKMKGIFE